MARQIRAGIDIGTSHVKVVIAEELGDLGVRPVGDQPMPKVLGAGVSESKGLRHGYIANKSEVALSIRRAVSLAEKMAGLRIKRAFVSIGGIGLSSITSSGAVIISRADLEITDRDMTQALETAEAAIPQSVSINRRIINTIPVEWKIDGKTVWGRVEGLKAQKLEVKALFITALEHHLEDLILAVEEAGIEVIDVVATPIAASLVNLTKKQKKAGCLLVNIGSETLSAVVFENNTPVSLEVFPIGSVDITNDIALGLKISLEEAESIKFGSITRSSYPKKKLEEIISARLGDMFELIEDHLKKINRHALLPAGIIVTGGGSGLGMIKDLAESELKLPCRIAEIPQNQDDKNALKDPIWSVAYGLTIVGFNAEDGDRSVGIQSADFIKQKGRRGLRVVAQWLSQFLP